MQNAIVKASVCKGVLQAQIWDATAIFCASLIIPQLAAFLLRNIMQE